MKKLGSFILIGTMVLFATSCEVETPKRYFEINGSRSSINFAYMDTWGVSDDLKSRWYAISFRSDEIEPENYMTFLLGSYTNETDIIAEGTYDYDYLGGQGLISDLSIGHDIHYDYLGLPSGTRYDEDVADFSGTITVERDGGKYRFIFDLEADYENSVYSITGEYNGTMVLNSDVVDIDTY